MGKIKAVWTQVSGQATSVGDVTSGAQLVTVSLTVPHRGLIRRVRVRDDGTGTGTPTIAASIAHSAAGATGLGVVLAYALAANPLDSEETIYYQVVESGTASRTGTLYVDVWTNDANKDHVLDIVIDIENLG
ncbi:MAG TPA: hypothetical protein EYN66_18205 [Myxococcales bacterium]|nr:hypothetical protein [Myxococcales bacterium]